MNTHAMKQAEHTADNIRGELWRTLEEIDRRRLAAMDWKTQVRARWRLLAAMGGVVAAMIAAKILISRRFGDRIPRDAARERGRSLRRAWRHPDRVAPARNSAPLDFGTKVLMVFGTAIASQLAKKFATKVVG